jgi:hypothetical protein
VGASSALDLKTRQEISVKGPDGTLGIKDNIINEWIFEVEFRGWSKNYRMVHARPIRRRDAEGAGADAKSVDECTFDFASVKKEVDSATATASLHSLAVVVKTPDKEEWCVKSEKTGRSFGCYPSREGAVKRLQQVEFFKNSAKFGSEVRYWVSPSGSIHQVLDHAEFAKQHAQEVEGSGDLDGVDIVAKFIDAGWVRAIDTLLLSTQTMFMIRDKGSLHLVDKFMDDKGYYSDPEHDIVIYLGPDDPAIFPLPLRVPDILEYGIEEAFDKENLRYPMINTVESALDGYKVEGSPTPGSTVKVVKDDGSFYSCTIDQNGKAHCSCPAGQFRGKCKHQDLVQSMVVGEDVLSPNPDEPPHELPKKRETTKGISREDVAQVVIDPTKFIVEGDFYPGTSVKVIVRSGGEYVGRILMDSRVKFDPKVFPSREEYLEVTKAVFDHIKPPVRKDIDVIMPLYEKGMSTIRPALSRELICGSTRRGRRDVHDVDGVVIGDAAQCADLAEKAGYKIIMKGPAILRFVVDDLLLDLLFSSDEAFGAAIMYRTGSKDFNIWMRARAKVMDMRLNEYGLFSKITGEKIGGTTEESIFEGLGLNYRAPSERNVAPALSIYEGISSKKKAIQQSRYKRPINLSSFADSSQSGESSNGIGMTPKWDGTEFPAKDRPGKFIPRWVDQPKPYKGVDQGGNIKEDDPRPDNPENLNKSQIDTKFDVFSPALGLPDSGSTKYNRPGDKPGKAETDSNYSGAGL